MSFRKLIVGFLLASLFAFCLIQFGFDIAKNNETNQSILDNSLMNSTYLNLEDDLSNLKDNAQKQRTAFEEEKTSLAAGYFILGTILGAAKIFMGIIMTFLNILFLPLSSIIGIPPVVLGVLTAILIVSLIFMAWRALKAGE